MILKVILTMNKILYENWLLKYNTTDDMNIVKLSNLMYVVYSWGLYMFNDPEIVMTDTGEVDETKLKNKLFDGIFKADFNGAIDPEMYNRYYKVYGLGVISKPEQDPIIDNNDVFTFMQSVNLIYGSLSRSELITYVHNELPWRIARNGLRPLDKVEHDHIITDSDIFKAKNKAFLKYLSEEQ